MSHSTPYNQNLLDFLKKSSHSKSTLSNEKTLPIKSPYHNNFFEKTVKNHKKIRPQQQKIMDKLLAQPCDNCSFCLSLKFRLKAYLMISSALQIKHTPNLHYHVTKNINDLITNKRTAKVISYKDMITFIEEQENLKRFYKVSELSGRLKNLTEFYQYHTEIPKLHIYSLRRVLKRYHTKKRKLEYIFVRKLLGFSVNNDIMESSYEPKPNDSDSSLEKDKNKGKDVVSHVLKDISYSKEHSSYKRIIDERKSSITFHEFSNMLINQNEKKGESTKDLAGMLQKLTENSFEFSFKPELLAKKPIVSTKIVQEKILNEKLINEILTTEKLSEKFLIGKLKNNEKPISNEKLNLLNPKNSKEKLNNERIIPDKTNTEHILFQKPKNRTDSQFNFKKKDNPQTHQRFSSNPNGKSMERVLEQALEKKIIKNKSNTDRNYEFKLKTTRKTINLITEPNTSNGMLSPKSPTMKISTDRNTRSQSKDFLKSSSNSLSKARTSPFSAKNGSKISFHKSNNNNNHNIKNGVNASRNKMILSKKNTETLLNNQNNHLRFFSLNGYESSMTNRLEGSIGKEAIKSPKLIKNLKNNENFLINKKFVKAHLEEFLLKGSQGIKSSGRLLQSGKTNNLEIIQGKNTQNLFKKIYQNDLRSPKKGKT